MPGCTWASILVDLNGPRSAGTPVMLAPVEAILSPQSSLPQSLEAGGVHLRRPGLCPANQLPRVGCVRPPRRSDRVSQDT